jgi:predicted HicB family RNase H-like nuclease
MNAMIYKGYPARVEYSEEDGCFVGHIVGINDIVGFHGDTVSELRASFEEAVDDYLQTCAKLGRPAQKPYSGNLTLRVSPEMHSAVAAAAEVSGKSINQWVTEKLADAVKN